MPKTHFKSVSFNFCVVILVIQGIKFTIKNNNEQKKFILSDLELKLE